MLLEYGIKLASWSFDFVGAQKGRKQRRKQKEKILKD